jgi:acyl-CoA reductase-like NAD-dependent aldehyde dehydrogenase
MTVHDEPRLPHGGMKNSGFGRFGSDFGMEGVSADENGDIPKLSIQ